MQPLQCETTVLRYPEIRFFIIFPRIFQDKFQNRHFIDFLSIFSHLGTPFRDLWLHFWGSLFQVTKKSKEFFGLRSWGEAICDPAGRRGEPPQVFPPNQVDECWDFTWINVTESLPLHEQEQTKKSPELFRNMLSACVFEKRFQKASGQHLLMILESF